MDVPLVGFVAVYGPDAVPGGCESSQDLLTTQELPGGMIRLIVTGDDESTWIDMSPTAADRLVEALFGMTRPSLDSRRSAHDLPQSHRFA